MRVIPKVAKVGVKKNYGHELKDFLSKCKIFVSSKMYDFEMTLF